MRGGELVRITQLYHSVVVATAPTVGLGGALNSDQVLVPTLCTYPSIVCVDEVQQIDQGILNGRGTLRLLIDILEKIR